MPHGGGSSSGSQSGLSENDKNRSALKNAIDSGKVKTKLDKRAQSKHKYGSKEYNAAIKRGDFPSYTDLSHMEVQKIVNEYSTKGKVYFDGGQFREVITLKETIGFYGDRRTNSYIPTNRATIHYSKDGTHLVPASPKGE